MDLTKSNETYLVVIDELEHEQRAALAKDIAERLGVSRASVTSSLMALSGEGMIDYEPYD